MNTEPELLNERLERLAIVLDEIMPRCAELVRDALALLKEQDSIINVLKSDLSETLEVVSKQLNVVRCKDCKKNGSFDCPLFTDAVEMEMDADWFCADGERKGNDEK